MTMNTAATGPTTINGVNVDTVMDPGRLVKRVIGGKLPTR